MNTGQIVTATVAATAVGVIAYALFFDYQRRSNPEFRRQLRRDYRRKARQEKEVAVIEQQRIRKEIHALVDQAKQEGYPVDVEEREAFFLSKLQEGESLAQDASSSKVDSALAFYQAMKVYPRPSDLVTLYDKSCPKDVLEILTEMIAYDETLDIGGSFSAVNLDDLASIPRAGLD